MRLGVISDTHGHLDYTARAVRVLQDQRVEAVIHCGDIGLPSVIPLFAGCPTHFIFGNVDHDQADLRMAINDAGLSCHERQGNLDIAGRRIAFVHGDDPGLLMELIASQNFDLICYGHTHEKELHTDGRTLVLNPGAVYRASPHTVAVVDLATMEAEHFDVE